MKRFKSMIIAITMISGLIISPLQEVKAKTDIDAAFNGESVSLDTGITPNPNADYDWQAETCTTGMGTALGFRVTAYVCDDESTLKEISRNTDLKSWIQNSDNRNRFSALMNNGICFYMFNKPAIQSIQSTTGKPVYFIKNSYAKGSFPLKFTSNSMGSGDIFHIEGNSIQINGNSFSKLTNECKLLDLSSDYSVSGGTISGLSQDAINNICDGFNWNANNISFDTNSFDSKITELLKSTNIRADISKRFAVYNDKVDWDNASILLYFEPMISMEIDIKGAIDTNGNNVYEPQLGDTQEVKLCFGLTPSDCAYIAGTSTDKMYKNGGNMHTDNIFYGVTDLIKTYMLSTRSEGTSGDASYDENASSSDIHDIAKCVLKGTYGAVSEVVALKDKPMRDDMWELPPAIQLFENGVREKATTINKSDWEEINEVLSYAKGLTTDEPSSSLYNNVKSLCQNVIKESYDAMENDTDYRPDYLKEYQKLWDWICNYYKNTPVTISGDANTVQMNGDITRTELFNKKGNILYKYSGVSSTIATTKVNVAEYKIYNNGNIVNGSKTTANGTQIASLSYGDLLKHPYDYYGIKESIDTASEPVSRPIVNVVDQNTSGDGSTTLTISNDIYNDVSSCYQWMRGDIDNYNGPLKNIYEVKRARRCYEYLKFNDFAGQSGERAVLNETVGNTDKARVYHNAFNCGCYDTTYIQGITGYQVVYNIANSYRVVDQALNVYPINDTASYNNAFDQLVMKDNAYKYYLQRIYADCSRNWDNWLEDGYEAICNYYDNKIICSSNVYYPNLYTRNSTKAPGGCNELKIPDPLNNENIMGSWYRTYLNTDSWINNAYVSVNTIGEQRNTWKCSSKVYTIEINGSGSISSVSDLKNAIRNKKSTSGSLTVGDLLRNPYGYGITYNSLEAAIGKGLQLDSWAWKQTTKVDIPGVDSLSDLHFDINRLIAIVEPDNKHTVNCEYAGIGTNKTVIQATITRNQSDNTAELSSLYTRSSLINSLYQDSVLQDYQNTMNDVGAPFNWFSVKSNAVKLVNASTARLNFNQNDTDIPIELKKKDAYDEVKTLATDTIKIKGIPTNGSNNLGTVKMFDSNKTSWGADKGYIKYGSLGNNGSFDFRCVFPMTANIINNKAFSIGFNPFFGLLSSNTKPTLGMSKLRDSDNTVWAYNDEWDKLTAQNTISVSYKGVPRLSGDWSTAQKDIETMKSTNIPVAYAGQVVPFSVEETNSGDSSYKNKLVITMYGLVALDRSGYATEFRGGYQTVDDFKNYVNTIANDVAFNSKMNIASTLSGVQTDVSKSNLGVQYPERSEWKPGSVSCTNGDTVGSVVSQNITYSMRQFEGRFGKNSLNTVNYGDYGISNVLGSNDEYFSMIDSLLYEDLSYNDWLYTDFEGFALVKAEVVMSYGTKTYNLTISKAESDSTSEVNELYTDKKSEIDNVWRSTFGLNVHNDTDMNAVMPYIDLSGCVSSFNLPSGGGTTCIRDLLGSYLCGCTTNINVRGSIFDNDNRK